MISDGDEPGKGMPMSDVITIENGDLTAQVKVKGAELASLKRGEDEYLWQADPHWWPRQAPVLFPIVGNLRNDKATSAAGPCAMGRHGVARINDFEVWSVGSGTVTMRLQSSDETLAAYPYPFVLDMTYTLEASTEGGAPDTLRQTFEVSNTGDQVMPFSVGGHPAFNVPAPGRTDAWEDYELVFSEPWTYASPGIAGGLWDYGIQIPIVDDADRMPLRRDLFVHDTVELEHVPGHTVTLASKESGPVLRVDFDEFPYLGVWSAGCETGDAPFLAIEPWTGTATRTDEDDVFEHKQHTLFCEPGDTMTRSFTITLL